MRAKSEATRYAKPSQSIAGLAVVGTIAILLAACAGADPGTKSSADPSPPSMPSRDPVGERVHGEYIVSLAPGASASAIERALAAYDPSVVRDLGSARHLVRLARDPGPEKVSAAVRGQVEINAIQPNFVYRASPVPSDRKLER
jgi:hypothetical protein